MSLKNFFILVSLTIFLLVPNLANANEDVSVNFLKKDIVVQNTHRYYPIKPILDKLAIKSKIEKNGDSVKLILTEGTKTYQVVLDEKTKLAYTSKGQFSYIISNNRLGFTGNFYSTILKGSKLSWNSKINSLLIYEKKLKGPFLGNLEAYKAYNEAVEAKKKSVKETYVPYENGQATWYGAALHGNLTASGEKFDMNALTAAHKTLPFGTKVRVTNLNNKSSVVVRITDRGPFAPGRVIDLSQAAAEKIDMLSAGVIPVQLDILKTA